MKAALETAVATTPNWPPLMVTRMGPVVTWAGKTTASGGTTAVRVVSETMAKLAGNPAKDTPVVVVKPVPVMVTVEPATPMVGLKDVIVTGGGGGGGGGGAGGSGVVLVKTVVEKGIPGKPTVLTRRGPVVANPPAVKASGVGTTAMMVVSETIVKPGAGTGKGPKLTVVAAEKPVPVIVTVEPAGALAGDTPVMVGGTNRPAGAATSPTVKFPELSVGPAETPPLTAEPMA